jgi:hypothetical protein
MLAPGTLGDVAAPAGLGERLRDAGHEVTIVADAPYAQLAADAGCAFQPVPADLRQIVAASAVSSQRQAPRRLRVLLRDMTRYFELPATAALEAAPGTGAVLFNAVAPYGSDIAEGLHIPSIGTFLQPVEPSAAYPPLATKLPSLGGLGNRIAGNLAQMMPASYDKACAQVRRELGAPAESRRAAAAGKTSPSTTGSARSSCPAPVTGGPGSTSMGTGGPRGHQVGRHLPTWSASSAADRHLSSSPSGAPPPHRSRPRPPSPPPGKPDCASSSRPPSPWNPPTMTVCCGPARSRTTGYCPRQLPSFTTPEPAPLRRARAPASQP